MEKRFDLRHCNKYTNNSLIHGFAPRDLGARPKTVPQEIQENGFLRSLENELSACTAIFGFHSAVKSRMEQDIVSKTQRHPGIPSSYIGLDLLMNVDDKIEISDILGRERATSPLGKGTVNDALESMFNIYF